MTLPEEAASPLGRELEQVGLEATLQHELSGRVEIPGQGDVPIR